MDSEILEVMMEYYKLKQQYDKRIERAKNRILKDTTLSRREKRQRFLQIKKKCVKCGKVGGTIFTDKNHILKASCGHLDAPCKLHIEVDKGNIMDLTQLVPKLKKDSIKDQREIMQTKLNLLFQYATEEETVEKFKVLQKQFVDDEKLYKFFKAKYIDILFNRHNSPVLEEKQKEFYRLLQQFKEYLKSYEAGAQVGFINDAIELYIHQILPLVTEIRNLTYKYSSVIYNENDNTWHLVEEPYTIEDLEVSVGEKPKIIANKT